ncbi:MAG: hypothetical protein R3C99_21865 [Pirellulaceae bacterium]
MYVPPGVSFRRIPLSQDVFVELGLDLFFYLFLVYVALVFT